MNLFRWWRAGPGAVPISNRLRVALVGFALLLLTRWAALSSGAVGYVPANFTRALIIVGIGAAVVATVTRWRCATVVALTVIFAAVIANIIELLIVWNETGFLHAWGIVTNVAFAMITCGLDTRTDRQSSRCP